MKNGGRTSWVHIYIIPLEPERSSHKMVVWWTKSFHGKWLFHHFHPFKTGCLWLQAVKIGRFMAPVSGEGAFCWVPQIYLLLIDQLSLRFKSSDVLEFLIPDLMAEMKKKTSPKCRFIREKMSYFKKELFMYLGISLQIILDPFCWCLFKAPKLFLQKPGQGTVPFLRRTGPRLVKNTAKKSNRSWLSPKIAGTERGH